MVTLTILIPTFNYDCRTLVLDLYAQAQELCKTECEFSFQILIADDCSTDENVRESLSELEKWKKIQTLRPPQNLGRALLCNYALERISSDYILLIDADAEVLRSDFLKQYWQHRKQAEVLVGGIQTPTQCPKGCELRHRYESSAEQIRTLSYRRAYPERHFSTFNVWFSKEALTNGDASPLRFDERCTEYGYEDMLLGLQLHRNGKQIFHIDNPLLHLGINENKVFLQNSEAAIRMLRLLSPTIGIASPLVRIRQKIERFGLLPILRPIFRSAIILLRPNLLSSHPQLWIFKLYKLSYFCLLP